MKYSKFLIGLLVIALSVYVVLITSCKKDQEDVSDLLSTVQNKLIKNNGVGEFHRQLTLGKGGYLGSFAQGVNGEIFLVGSINGESRTDSYGISFQPSSELFLKMDPSNGQLILSKFENPVCCQTKSYSNLVFLSGRFFCINQENSYGHGNRNVSSRTNLVELNFNGIEISKASVEKIGDLGSCGSLNYGEIGNFCLSCQGNGFTPKYVMKINQSGNRNWYIDGDISSPLPLSDGNYVSYKNSTSGLSVLLINSSGVPSDTIKLNAMNNFTAFDVVEIDSTIYFCGTNMEQDTAIIVSMDLTGQQSMRYNLPGIKHTVFTKIDRSSTGNILVASTTLRASNGYYQDHNGMEILVIKPSSNSLLKTVSITQNLARINDLEPTADNGFVVLYNNSDVVRGRLN